MGKQENVGANTLWKIWTFSIRGNVPGDSFGVDVTLAVCDNNWHFCFCNPHFDFEFELGDFCCFCASLEATYAASRSIQIIPLKEDIVYIMNCIYLCLHQKWMASSSDTESHISVFQIVRQCSSSCRFISM